MDQQYEAGRPGVSLLSHSGRISHRNSVKQLTGSNVPQVEHLLLQCAGALVREPRPPRAVKLFQPQGYLQVQFILFCTFLCVPIFLAELTGLP